MSSYIWCLSRSLSVYFSQGRIRPPLDLWQASFYLHWLHWTLCCQSIRQWPPALASIIAIIGHVCNFMESLAGTTRVYGWKDRRGSKSSEIHGLSNLLSVHQLWVPLGNSSVARRYSLHSAGFLVSKRVILHWTSSTFHTLLDISSNLCGPDPMQLWELLRPDVAEDLGKIASALHIFSCSIHTPQLSPRPTITTVNTVRKTKNQKPNKN